MKNLVVPLLGAVSIVSTGTVAWLLATPPSVDPRTVKLEAELQEARQTIAKLKADLASKTAAPAAIASSSGAASADPAAPGGASNPAVPAPPANFREMLKNPGMRTLIEQQQAAQIEIGYGKLFERLRLSPEEREHFKKLLTARQKVMTDIGLQMMDSNTTDQKRQELIAESERQQAAYTDTIKQFLNEQQDYAVFQSWERSLPERTTFDAIGRGLFNASAEPLSPEQEERLLNLMAETRASNSGPGINAQTNGDPSKVTEEMLNQQIEQVKARNQIILERASEFLTPGQLRTQQSYLDQALTLAKSGQWFLRGAGR